MQELIGKVFGQRTVIALAGRDKGHRLLVLAECSCGRKDKVVADALLRGRAKSCKNCVIRARGRATKNNWLTYRDFLDKKINSFTVIDFSDLCNGLSFLCKCDCGHIQSFYSNAIKEAQLTCAQCGAGEKRAHELKAGDKYFSKIILERTRAGYLAQCICGKVGSITITQINRGLSKTCLECFNFKQFYKQERAQSIVGKLQMKIENLQKEIQSLNAAKLD